MTKQKITLGIDIGGTTTTFGYVDFEGNIIAEAQIPTQAEDHVTSYLPRVFEAVKELFTQISNDYELIGIGIGAPNANYYRGTVENPPNLKWGGVVHIADIFEKEFKVPTVITNDANAAAIGEMKFGIAKGMKNFILITLGTGLGSGFIVNGELVYGHSGFAGEMGHVQVNPNGRKCGCGKVGCLETYVSVTGIRRTVSKLLADTMEFSELRNVSQNDLTGEMITQAALKGDKVAIDAFEYTANVLGRALANAVAHTSPEAIILFGGLANARDLIIQPTLNYMDKHLFSVFKGTVRIMLSGLMDQNAAVLGASALLWHELEKKD